MGMGPELDLMVPSTQSVAVSAYIDFLPDVQYSKPLGSARFLKTIKCLDSTGACVVKLLIKPNSELDLAEILKRMEKLRQSCNGIPNVLPFHQIIDSQRACYFVRPYIRYNLYDRFSIRPFLEPIEKKWIVFQLLTAVARLHNKKIYHGDIKSENVLVTSWNWALLSDFASLKPVYLPEANPSQYSFYFDTAQRHSCYLAPERFVPKNDKEVSELNSESRLTPQMDIFALGCLIAEIYTEGLPIFTLSQIFRYKKGEYTPNLDAIKDPSIPKMIRSMISLDPGDRLSAQEYLVKYRRQLFPDSFYTFLHPYVRKLSESNGHFRLCDQRILQMYNDFNKIALYLGFKRQLTTPKNAKEGGDVSNVSSSASDTGKLLLPLHLTMPGMYRHIPQSTSAVFKEGSLPDCTCLILLAIVLHNVRNTTHASFRIKACDLILAFSEQLHDEAKLDRCLPYLTYMLDDPSEDVQSAALRAMTQLLSMVDSITPINVYLFPEYLIPKLQKFLKRSYDSPTQVSQRTASVARVSSTDRNPSPSPSPSSFPPHSYVRMVFAQCLPHIALASKRFYQISNLLTTELQTFHDPETEGTAATHKPSPDLDYASLLEGFESITIQIMTDPDPYVRIGLLNNILPLCTFFGKEKTNDVILSHLITYLNDKNSQLKTAFVSSIVSVSVFVGIIGLEQYILPLLVQAVTDPCEMVVIDLLKVFANLVNLGFIRKHYLWDLIRLTIKLVLHPNDMIRESVLNLVIAVGNTLSIADLYCTLYPIIRPYFQHEVTKFNWEELFVCICSPIPRSVYNISKSWSLSHEPTLFWQRVPDTTSKTDSFGNRPLKFMKKRGGNGGPRSIDDTIVDNYDIPLSMEDSKQVERLRNIGFPETELWKIATMRSYIYRVAQLDASSKKHEKDINYSRVNILPRSVFVDVSHTLEQVKRPVNGNNSVSSVAISQHATPSATAPKDALNPPAAAANSRRPRSTSPTPSYNPASSVLLLGDTAKKVSAPSISETSGTAFGDTHSLREPSVKAGSSIFSTASGFSVQNETLMAQKLVTTVKHSYQGSNPYIMKFLQSISFDAKLSDYPEFGTEVKAPENKDDEVPSGTTLVSRLVEHKSRVNCVATSPDCSFFVTGDEQGLLKFWDTARLETNVTGRSICSMNLGGSICSIEFIKNRNCFAVSTKDGLIRIFRVQLQSRSKYRRKNITVILTRQYQVEPEAGGYAIEIHFALTDEKPYLAFSTPDATVTLLDIRTMSVVIVIQNNVSHGIPTAFAVGTGGSWLLVGTSKGVLDLWDLSFELLLRSVKFRDSSYPIRRICTLPDDYQLNGVKGRFIALVGGTGHSDVTVWDLAKLQPYMLMSSSSVGSTIDNYSVVELKDDDGDIVNEDLAQLVLTAEKLEKDKSCTTLAVNTKYLCSATSSGKIILWDMVNPRNSRVVVEGFDEPQHDTPSFSQTQINNLTIVNEIYTRQADRHNGASGGSDGSVSKAHRDLITSMSFVVAPYQLVLSVERSGTINVYR